MDPELEPDSASKDAGFTLIELLVSIAVLSVLALGATLALPRGSGSATQDMALFQRQFEQMRQLAITGQSSRGLIIDPTGLRLASRQESNAADPQGNPPLWGKPRPGASPRGSSAGTDGCSLYRCTPGTAPRAVAPPIFSFSPMAAALPFASALRRALGP